MSTFTKQSRMFFVRGVITAVYPEDRVVDAVWSSGNQTISRADVLNNTSVYSFPSVNEEGLFIGDETGWFYLGKLDRSYRNRIAGEKQEDGTKITAKKVNGGESLFMNLAKSVWLSFPNSGNFSLITGALDGIRYLANSGNFPVRFLKAVGQTVKLIGAGHFLSLGTVIRDIPTMGEVPVVNTLNQQNGVEFLVTVNNAINPLLEMAKLHLGDIFQAEVPGPTGGQGTVELSTSTIAPAPLRGVFSIFNDLGIEVSYIKADSMGHIELAAPLPGNGTMFITSGTTLSLDSPRISIGANAALGTTATEPAVLGNKFLAWLNNYLTSWVATHQHPTSTGPSGPPLVPPNEGKPVLTTDFCSLKVFVA